MSSPDDDGRGLTQGPVDPARYDGHMDHCQEVAGILWSLMPSCVRVMDVGCGTGSVTILANRSRDNTVVALEPDDIRAAIARSRGIDVRTGFLEGRLQEELGKFQVIMSSDVLEHTPAPELFIANILESLEPDGILLLSVPNVAHWSVRLMILMGRFDYEEVGIMDATHLRWFTKKSLIRLLEHCGLGVLEMHQTAGVTLPIYTRGLLGRIPRRLLWPLVRLGTVVFPLLFGVQHVVKANRKVVVATSVSQ